MPMRPKAECCWRFKLISEQRLFHLCFRNGQREWATLIMLCREGPLAFLGERGRELAVTVFHTRQTLLCPSFGQNIHPCIHAASRS